MLMQGSRDAEMPTPPPQREVKNGKQATFIAGRAAREVFTVLWERRISQDVNRGSYTMVSSKNKQKSQERNSWLLNVFTSMQWKVVVVVLSEALWGYMSDCVSLSSLHYSSPPLAARDVTTVASGGDTALLPRAGASLEAKLLGSECPRLHDRGAPKDNRWYIVAAR